MEPQARTARSPWTTGVVVIGGLALVVGVIIAMSGSPGFGTALAIAAIGDLALAGVFIAARSAWRNAKNR